MDEFDQKIKQIEKQFNSIDSNIFNVKTVSKIIKLK